MCGSLLLQAKLRELFAFQSVWKMMYDFDKEHFLVYFLEKGNKRFWQLNVFELTLARIIVWDFSLIV